MSETSNRERCRRAPHDYGHVRLYGRLDNRRPSTPPRRGSERLRRSSPRFLRNWRAVITDSCATLTTVASTCDRGVRTAGAWTPAAVPRRPASPHGQRREERRRWAWKRPLLGYSLASRRAPRLRIAPASIERMKERVRKVFRRNRGVSLKRVIDDVAPNLRGWLSCYRLTETPSVLVELDSWLLRTLRCYVVKQCGRNSRLYAC